MTFGVLQAVGIDPRAVCGPGNSIVGKGSECDSVAETRRRNDAEYPKNDSQSFTPDDVRRLTIKRNTVAVVTDGSAVLGLGNLGEHGAA